MCVCVPCYRYRANGGHGYACIHLKCAQLLILVFVLSQGVVVQWRLVSLFYAHSASSTPTRGFTFTLRISMYAQPTGAASLDQSMRLQTNSFRRPL